MNLGKMSIALAVGIVITGIMVTLDSYNDFRTLKKVHRATILGVTLVILGIALTVTLIESPGWSSFLESTLGKG